MCNMFLISFYSIILKDLLRFFEHYFSLPIPLTLFPLILTVVSVFFNIHALKKDGLGFYHFFAIGLILLDFIVIAINLSFFESLNYREIIGVSFMHMFIPMYVITNSNRFDFYMFFVKKKRLLPLAIAVIGIGFAQLVFFKIMPSAALQLFDGFYQKGWIELPYQVSRSGIYLRTMSVFYAAFPFGLFIVFVYAVTIFSKIKPLVKLMLSILFLMILVSTYNRNACIAYGVVTIFKIIEVMKPHNKRAFLACLLLFGVSTTNLIVPYVFVEMSNSFFEYEQNPYMKTTTVGSRVKSWKKILVSSASMDIVFGTGTIQGVGMKDDSSSMLIDNFLMYKLKQSGLVTVVFWCFFFLVLIRRSMRNLLNDSKHSFFCASLLGSFLIMANLNNLFYEPVYQLLYFGMILSLLKKTQVRDREHSEECYVYNSNGSAIRSFPLVHSKI